MPINPIFFEPGSSISPSSAKIITPGLIENFAVSEGLSLVVTELPIPPSVDPMVSIKVIS